LLPTINYQLFFEQRTTNNHQPSTINHQLFSEQLTTNNEQLHFKRELIGRVFPWTFVYNVK